MSDSPLSLYPIGHVRSPYRERVEAPRQPRASEGVHGRVELLPGRHFEDALSDLAEWRYIWLLTWFDRNEGWRPKVRPPRSDRKRGVFATRAPYRPNPIGLSAVRLLSVQGLTLHIAELDLLDGTPVLDIKPYLAWADAIGDAGDGWLGDARAEDHRPSDPGPRYRVIFTSAALEQLKYLEKIHGLELTSQIERVLSTGPRPHAYRRIRALGGDRYRLALKDWRVQFELRGDVVQVLAIASGYRPGNATRPVPAVHEDFQARFAVR